MQWFSWIILVVIIIQDLMVMFFLLIFYEIDIWLMYVVAPFGLDHHLRSYGCVATFDFFALIKIFLKF
jgi:hypothetical protein